MNKSNNSQFIENDQKLMTDAVNYRKYLYSLIEPYINGDVLEVGSGIGNITEAVLRNKASAIKTLFCIEPQRLCIKSLQTLSNKYKGKVNIIEGSFPSSVPNKHFNCIYSFNVLEHIENDYIALKTHYNLLSAGGYICLFVPAFPMLFGSMDHYLQHHRRYRKTQLSKQLKDAGFTIVSSRYCNITGFFGWFINNRILKITSQKRGQIYIFDKFILPIQSTFEKLIPPPIGQNLFIVGKKN
ncbi:MAG: class I SAM-dependent methyltransferase [Candidatus Theseobacter exili]|nr:class I SAM-dependent methyltransferase [Candidatus Theseobacter exili]